MNYYLKVLIISIALAIADLIWIYFNNDMYLGTVKKVQKSSIEMSNYIYIPLAYAFIVLGFFTICMTFVEYQIQKYRNIDRRIVAFLAGGFYGVLAVSSYHFTSLVAYKDYSVYLIVVDSIWQFMLFGIMSVIYTNI